MLKSAPMIKSMTGYGIAETIHGHCAISVQIRAVNNRFADIRVRLPQEWLLLENTLRRRVQNTVKRGRVDVSIKLERATGIAAVPGIDLQRAEGWLQALKEVSALEGVEPRTGGIDAVTLIRLPGVIDDGLGTEDLEGLEAAIIKTLDKAVENFDQDRIREGQTLAKDLKQRFDAMQSHVEFIEEWVKSAPAELKQRMEERLQKLDAEITLDPARVAQEALLLADRADVTEEVVRLHSHLERAHELLVKDTKQPVGKRLDFLLQEIHRETNTIGSKAQQLPVAKRMLDLKSEAEKIREQVQNLE